MLLSNLHFAGTLLDGRSGAIHSAIGRSGQNPANHRNKMLPIVGEIQRFPDCLAFSWYFCNFDPAFSCSMIFMRLQIHTPQSRSGVYWSDLFCLSYLNFWLSSRQTPESKGSCISRDYFSAFLLFLSSSKDPILPPWPFFEFGRLLKYIAFMCVPFFSRFNILYP